MTSIHTFFWYKLQYIRMNRPHRSVCIQHQPVIQHINPILIRSPLLGGFLLQVQHLHLWWHCCPLWRWLCPTSAASLPLMSPEHMSTIYMRLLCRKHCTTKPATQHFIAERAHYFINRLLFCLEHFYSGSSCCS